jgi:hypothetical protein
MKHRHKMGNTCTINTSGIVVMGKGSVQDEAPESTSFQTNDQGLGE